MPRALPLIPSEPNYRLGTQLDGTQYVIDCRWNSRAEAWYLDVLDANADPIRTGIKIVLGAALGARCTDPRFPQGLFLASDLSGQGREAGLDDLGVRVFVYYYPRSEL